MHFKERKVSIISTVCQWSLSFSLIMFSSRAGQNMTICTQVDFTLWQCRNHSVVKDRVRHMGTRSVETISSQHPEFIIGHQLDYTHDAFWYTTLQKGIIMNYQLKLWMHSAARACDALWLPALTTIRARVRYDSPCSTVIIAYDATMILWLHACLIIAHYAAAAACEHR